MPRSMYTKRSSKISFDPDKGRTEQAHASRCDINKILGKFRKTGVLTHVNRTPAEYANLPKVPSFFEANLIIANAKSTFESLPAKLRADFNNNPAEFLEFMEEPENHELLEQWGFTTNHLDILPDTDSQQESAPDQEQTSQED